jgi:HD superfamily phosphohydrolase
MVDVHKAGRIRDPIHGYVSYTGIERIIIDSPIAQRLRHIGQSGMAQMVFPEVRSSRFSHSLGAMHLASEFLAASIANADDATRSKVESAMGGAINDLASLGLGAGEMEIRAFLQHQGLRVGGSVSDECRVTAMLFEQGLRLAALFHDLGHLPFSHDFEGALEELLRPAQSNDFAILVEQHTTLAIHERLGYRLAHHLQRQLFQTMAGGQEGKAVEISFQIAERILAAPSPSASGAEPPTAVDGLFGWLHSMIAGELDVDRCDYILRDTRHYGFEFASYDLKRIVDNLVVVGDGGSHGLVLAILPQGQSAVESFLLARYRMYQWGPRHHKVVQVASALRKVIRDLLRPAVTGNLPEDLRLFLEDITAIVASEDKPDFAEKAPDVIDRFVGYDDVWWTTKMREAAKANSEDPWLALVCSRRPGPKSAWKRPLDFPVPNIEEWNAQLPPKDDLEAGLAWEAARASLEADGVLVVRHSFRPWEPRDKTDPDSDSLLSLWDPGRQELIPLTRVSPITKSLAQAWLGDLQVHASMNQAGRFSADEILAKLPVGTAEEDD